jgi:FAD/FMN-containing dehydrogenase
MGTVGTGTTVASFKGGFGGVALTPGDEVRRGARDRNSSFDKHPAVIARCRTTADVVAAMLRTGKRARSRCRAAGWPRQALTCEDGVVADPLRAVEVDAEARVAGQAGATWADFDAATRPGPHQHRRADHRGRRPGLTLGGIGQLMRKHGLACDSLIEPTW